MEIAEIKYLGELRTQANHLKSGNIVITDAPPDNQGRGEAFSPTDLLCASLASCMLTIMGISARNHGYDIDGATAKIYKFMLSDPRRVGEIKVEFNFPFDNYSEKTKLIIEKAAKTCPVALSLNPEIKQTIIFNYGL
jgi:putative redox protein